MMRGPRQCLTVSQQGGSTAITLVATKRSLQCGLVCDDSTATAPSHGCFQDYNYQRLEDKQSVSNKGCSSIKARVELQSVFLLFSVQIMIQTLQSGTRADEQQGHRVGDLLLLLHVALPGVSSHSQGLIRATFAASW
jgi:hypothetical protein